MTSLIIHAVLGVATTAFVVWHNRRLFSGGWRGARVTPLEGAFYLIALVSVGLGWYFNIQYVAEFGARASWIHFTKSLFSNWAADSAAQDYIIANVVLFPLWTIIDGRRRGIRVPWGFFVISLFTSFGFAMAAYLAVVERQIRYTRAFPPAPDAVPAADPAASSTA
jgi:Terpene cyclase DEP1